MSKKIPATNTNDSVKEQILANWNKQKETTDENKNKYSNEFTNKWNMNNRVVELFAKEIEKDQRLRIIYDVILIGILIVELIALIVIFILVGCNKLHYSDTTFNIFITGGIAEVFTLVTIIVKYLFKDNLTKALNIILENNNKIRYKNKNKNIKSSDKP